MAFSSSSDTLAVLWESGYVELWSLKTRLQVGREKVMDPTRTWSGEVGESARQIQLSSSAAADATSSLSVLRSGQDSDTLTLLRLADLDKESSGDLVNVPLKERNYRLVAAEEHIAFQSPNGTIYGCTFQDVNPFTSIELLPLDNFEEKTLSPVAQFPESCLQSQNIPFSGDSAHSTFSHAVYAGLASSGKLFIASGESSHTLATNATSFAVASGFMIFTTTAHEATFIPLDKLRGLLNDSNGAVKPGEPNWETRRVERGSRIVVAVPSAMSLVLQMPRGNLETINPRPLVMEVVRKDIDE